MIKNFSRDPVPLTLNFSSISAAILSGFNVSFEYKHQHFRLQLFVKKGVHFTDEIPPQLTRQKC